MQKAAHKHTNNLINETSPYLLSHAHNPVNWHSWSGETLENAKRENKLLIISIGYAACHWCHVMERESFEDEAVAEIMNQFFVPIKIDREERPDVDQIYMNACMLVSGRGGWPLNAIALPDGKPVYAGTYYPKENWVLLLKQISELWKSTPEKIVEQAEALTTGIRRSDIITQNNTPPDFTLANIENITNHILENIDFELGGQTGAPKFPMPVGFDFLMQYYFYSKNSRALNAVKTTLDQMAMGGIYDQIGGGFARYSVDQFWLVPHFEKMLYDNAQLVSLYSKAFQLTGKELYKNTVYQTIDFIERELTSPEGAFYSSLDADSEGEEGKFYVWEKSEIEKLLGSDADLICEYYNITDKGNWEDGKNITHVKYSDIIFSELKNIDLEIFKSKLNSANKILLISRRSRISPALDDKIITAWNALMINGLVDAYRIFGENSFLTKAKTSAEFLLNNCIAENGVLHRNYKNGKSNISGFLDDYAFLIDALINLYQATFEKKWLLKAGDLAKHTLIHFFDRNSGMFFYTSDKDPELIARKMEISDNVIPSSNSAMAWNLFRLGKYFDRPEFLNMSKQMLNNVKTEPNRGGIYYSNWNILMLKFIEDPFEVAINGEYASKFREEFDKHYCPNIIFSGTKEKSNLPFLKDKLINEETTIFVCKDKICQKPVNNVNEALKILK